MKTKRAFVVEVDMPEGVGVSEMRHYIREAISTWWKGKDPESRLFIPRNRVVVKAVPLEEEMTKDSNQP